MITIFLGAPGTGKGTVASILAEKYGFKHVSTGDLFREIFKSGSELALELKAIVDGGNLINDEKTNEVLVEGLKKFDLKNDRLILDGYPRTIPQAKFLEKYVEEHGIKLTDVIFLQVDSEIQIQRLTGRQTCPNCGKGFHKYFMKPKVEDTCDACGTTLVQRGDDKLENVMVRLETYEELTAPVVDFYKEKGMIKSLDTNQDAEALAAEIDRLIK